MSCWRAGPGWWKRCAATPVGKRPLRCFSPWLGPLSGLLVTAALYKVYAVIMLLLGSGMLYYYYRMFAVLGQMRW